MPAWLAAGSRTDSSAYYRAFCSLVTVVLVGWLAPRWLLTALTVAPVAVGGGAGLVSYVCVLEVSRVGRGRLQLRIRLGWRLVAAAVVLCLVAMRL